MSQEAKPQDCSAQDILKRVVSALKEKKGEDILVFDARATGNITDYYILVSAFATPHLKALMNAARLALKSGGVLFHRRSGTPESGWIVLDYMDVVLHIFDKETRAYYDLEALWKNMPRVDVQPT